MIRKFIIEHIFDMLKVRTTVDVMLCDNIIHMKHLPDNDTRRFKCTVGFDMPSF